MFQVIAKSLSHFNQKREKYTGIKIEKYGDPSISNRSKRNNRRLILL